MNKYLASISYDGSHFHGWAKQPSVFTVQGFIEKRISSTFSCKVSLTSSSRTDKGVHAIDQKFTFSLDSINIEESRMKKILNDCLEKFIKVNSVLVVEENFNLKKDVLLKEYRYYIVLKDFNIFQKNYFLDASNQNIDIRMLEEKLKKFEGDHDFFNFSYVRERNKSSVETFRKIEKINVKKINEHLLCVEFFSKGFLRYQIRAILGECIDKHKKPNGDLILSLMIACKEKMKYKNIAAPSGLYLWKVYLNSENKK